MSESASPPARRLLIAMVGRQDSIHIQRWSGALAARGHRIIPIDLAARGRSPASKAIDFLRIRRRIARVLRRPDSVAAIHYVPGGAIATGLRGLHPVVLSAWGRDVTGHRPGALGRLYGWQMRGFMRRAEAVTATSAFLADTVRRRFELDATVIPFGVDTELFSPPDEATREAGPLRIGFVKWLEPKYGPDVMVEALGILGPEVDFRVFVAGDGSMRAALETRLHALGLADRITFLGRLPHADVPGLLSGIDVFVMPSREEEWGVAAAEASAMALPVVATAVGGIPEIVVDGETGLLVPPEDPVALAAAIRRLAGDPELRRSFGRAGRERVERLFRWDACVDRMEATYRDAVEHAGERRGATSAATAAGTGRAGGAGGAGVAPAGPAAPAGPPGPTETPAPPAPPGTPVCRLMGPGDVAGAAALHREVFSDYFLGHMGQRFLEAFYSEFVSTPGNYGLVAVAGGRVVGSVVGATDLPRFFHDFYRGHFPTLAASFAVRLARDGYVRRHSAARLTHVTKAIRSRLGIGAASAPDPNAWPAAQLLSIGVARAYRGSGIAQELTERFCDLLAADGVDAVGLSVLNDNPRAIAFYESTGWTRNRSDALSTTFWRRLGAVEAAAPEPSRAAAAETP